MRALVTGATGFLGVHLCRRMVERGDHVVALVRDATPPLPLPDAVRRLKGDVQTVASLEAAMDGVDAVFHLAGIRRAPTRDAFFAVNAQGTQNVCEAMLARAPKARLVLAGSLAAVGPAIDGRPRTEADPFRPSEWYGESKAEAEKIAFSYRDRLEVTAIRPARILGEGDKENLFFFRLLKKGLFLELGGGPRKFSFVDVADVVELLLVLAERKEAVGEAFFSSAEALTLDELQTLVAEELGVTPRHLRIAPSVLRALAAGADAFSAVTGKHLPLNRKLARQLLAPGWTCSTEKVERVLGFHHTHKVAQAAKRSAEWYRASGWL